MNRQVFEAARAVAHAAGRACQGVRSAPRRLARDPRRASGLGQDRRPGCRRTKAQRCWAWTAGTCSRNLTSFATAPGCVTSRPRCTGSSSPATTRPRRAAARGGTVQAGQDDQQQHVLLAGSGGQRLRPQRGRDDSRPFPVGRARRPRGRSRAAPAGPPTLALGPHVGLARGGQGGRRGPRGRGRRPGPTLREQVRLCWKRGVNPRVYSPFLPHGYEQSVGLDYFGGETEPRP